MTETDGVRLNKWLAEKGLASRRRSDELIAAGKVKINGRTAEVGQKVQPTDRVELSDETVAAVTAERVYVLLNKLPGYTTAAVRTTADPTIVLDLLTPTRYRPQPGDSRSARLPARVFPIGRLDKDTRGLLLLTNDGVLAYRLTHPKFSCEKEYAVTVATPLTAERVAKLRAGVQLDGRPTRPMPVSLQDPHHARVILREGRNRQIRKVFGKVGCEVTNLKRIRVQGLWLPRELPPGTWRFLSAEEVQMLRAD